MIFHYVRNPQISNVALRKRVFRHTDSVAPDQPTHPCSLIWELHCPLFCKLGSDWFVSRQCSSQIRICPKTHFRVTRLDLDCPHMAYSTYLSGSYINIVWTWIKKSPSMCSKLMGYTQTIKTVYYFSETTCGINMGLSKVIHLIFIIKWYSYSHVWILQTTR